MLIVLKYLGKDKARDAESYLNEIFKEEVAGSYSLEALVKIMNLIKRTQKYPKVMEKCNITSIHKKRVKNSLKTTEECFGSKF